MKQWKLMYKARRTGSFGDATEAMLSHPQEQDFEQTADPRFTAECLDILLADETVTVIHLYPMRTPELTSGS